MATPRRHLSLTSRPLVVALVSVILTSAPVHADTTTTTSTAAPSAGSTSTTPTTTSAATSSVASTTLPSKLGGLFILGDSLCLGAEIFGKLSTAVKASAKWSSVTSDCKLGRRALDGLSILENTLRSRADLSGIVVAMGTNDLLSRREKTYPAWIIDQMMTRAKGKPVLWVEVTYGGVHPDYVGRARRFNSALASATKKYPNLSIAPWFAAYPSKTRLWERDGIHPTVPGYRIRGTFLAKEISSFATFAAMYSNR